MLNRGTPADCVPVSVLATMTGHPNVVGTYAAIGPNPPFTVCYREDSAQVEDGFGPIAAWL